MRDPFNLAEAVESLHGTHVLVIGDLMLDRFVTGTVERISPEAPIPVLNVDTEATMLGGAGNVVRNLVALGARTQFVSVIGDDLVGHEVEDLVSKLGHVLFELAVEPGRTTSMKSRYMAAGQQMLRADQESQGPIGESGRRKVLAQARNWIHGCGVMVLSDYGKGVLADGLAAELIAIAAEAKRPVIVDPKGQDFAVYRGATVVTPNRRELSEASRMPVGDTEQIVVAARHLIGTCDLGGVLVTRSQDGMTLVPARGEVIHLAAEAREVYDVSGAGDTVVATLAAGLAAEAPIEQAAALANAAAGIVVGKVGTAVAYASEVAASLHHRDLMDAEEKVQLLEPALDRIGKWRRAGLRVGFTNGCFDLLHPGHVSLLTQARNACERLVVGVNTDSSVRRLKGDGRPIQGEMARATVLASLAQVDLVVLFSEDTPLSLIEAVRPDVLVKGADYAEAEVVGAPFVRSYGGRILLADLAAGHSTTNTISRITDG